MKRRGDGAKSGKSANGAVASASEGSKRRLANAAARKSGANVGGKNAVNVIAMSVVAAGMRRTRRMRSIETPLFQNILEQGRFFA